MREIRDTLTPREVDEYNQEKELAKLQADYQMRYKQLDLEIKKLELKWTQVFRLPFAVLMLPVRLILSLAVPISVITKKELPESYWIFLKQL